MNYSEILQIVRSSSGRVSFSDLTKVSLEIQAPSGPKHYIFCSCGGSRAVLKSLGGDVVVELPDCAAGGILKGSEWDLPADVLIHFEEELRRQKIHRSRGYSDRAKKIANEAYEKVADRNDQRLYMRRWRGELRRKVEDLNRYIDFALSTYDVKEIDGDKLLDGIETLFRFGPAKYKISNEKYFSYLIDRRESLSVKKIFDSTESASEKRYFIERIREARQESRAFFWPPEYFGD
ncbi:hypothetical protein LZA78_03870 [Sinirhodobacter sp. WL0062]|uniref:Uncharacterized protein n=1 Tax=Rhodobacter flavimaris TaxID=2907145 RepID=A0ABS8YSD8_9RHOB|nr:hypothetical protein [Sinirhodobacter sp. WL0062]MCE5972613.1 hypothetical protein [Sinirhodobacter sp. WL0062]